MNRIIRNTSSLLSAHLIGRFASLVITVWLMPRFFTENAQGGYFVAIALTNLIASLTELGMQNPLIREMTLHREQTCHYLGNALLIRLGLSVIAYGLMIVVGRSLGYSSIIVMMIAYLGLAEIINSIAQLYRCVFRAHEEMKYEGLTVIVERGIFFLVGAALILRGYDLLNVCQVLLIASGVNLFMCVGFTRYRFTPLRFEPSRQIVTILMQQALPFAIGNLFNLIYFRVDAIILSKLSPYGVDANTWYGLPYTIVNAFTIIPGAFMMGAMFPVLSRAYEQERDKLADTYTFGVRWMTITGVPLAVGLATLSHELTALLFATKSLDTIEKIASALQWLGISGGMIFLTSVVLTVLRAADKRRAFSILMGTTALLNILLNIYLIPRYSHVGAAVAMVVSEAYVLIIGFSYISKYITKLTTTGFIFKTIVISALMGIVLVLLKGIISVLILIPLAILFYGGGIYLLGEFRTELE